LPKKSVKKPVKKTSEGIEVSFREDSTGLHVDICCEHCHKPITVTSERFGMDCEDHCAERAFAGSPEEDLANPLHRVPNVEKFLKTI
jgi:hypothetical protein